MLVRPNTLKLLFPPYELWRVFQTAKVFQGLTGSVDGKRKLAWKLERRFLSPIFPFVDLAKELKLPYPPHGEWRAFLGQVGGRIPGLAWDVNGKGNVALKLERRFL